MYNKRVLNGEDFTEQPGTAQRAYERMHTPYSNFFQAKGW